MNHSTTFPAKGLAVYAQITKSEASNRIRINERIIIDSEGWDGGEYWIFFKPGYVVNRKNYIRSTSKNSARRQLCLVRVSSMGS